MKQLIIALLSICSVMPVFAQQTGPATTVISSLQHSDTRLSEHHEVESKRQAGAWGLKVEEWQRYQDLMQGPLGIYSPGLDPLTALGIEARSDEERRYYAELQVQAESRRVDKELAYQLAYDQAFKRLYPGLLPLADTMDSTTQLSGNGRLALFVEENCPACDLQAKQMQKNGDAFDVYFVGSRNDDVLIRRWASKVGIDPQKVISRTITLNHDGGRWAALDMSSSLPTVVREVDGQWISR